MFFFDGDQDGPMVLRFGQSDSFWYDYKTLKDFPGKFRSFEFNNDMLDEKTKKLFEDNKINLDEFRERCWIQKHLDDYE